LGTLSSRGALAQISPSFDNSGRSACTSAQVVQLGAANAAETGHLDLVNARGVDKERAFDANPVGGDPANSEVLIDPASTPPNDDALEYLDSLTRAFNNFGVNANGIARSKLRDFLELFLFDGTNQLGNHNSRSLSMRSLALAPAKCYKIVA